MAQSGHSLVTMNQAGERTRFGDTVAAQIERSGMSLRIAAEQAGIPWATFHRRIRSSATSFTLGELMALAEVLGTTPSAILAEYEAAA